MRCYRSRKGCWEGQRIKGDNVTPGEPATIEEVAAALSVEEGREVSPQEVREIESRALRKLRQEMARRHLRLEDLAPALDPLEPWCYFG